MKRWKVFARYSKTNPLRSACYCFLIVIGLNVNSTFGQIGTLSGKVTNPDQSPLSYASVYVKGTTNGTTTNENGNYTLRLAAGSHTVIFQYMGYQQEERNVTIREHKETTLNVTLEKRAYETEAVTVTGKDPAYRIIKNAIASKEAHRKAVKTYQCELYSKTTIKADSAAASSIVDSGDLPPGYVYFSESISELKYQYPDDYQEVMQSSKVSGRDEAVSLNFAFNTPVIFYKDLIGLGGGLKRPLISPIADNALNYYKYRLQNTYQENGKRIHRISVIPKRPNDPIFKGQIRIVDNSWHIHSLNLKTTKSNGLKSFDTFTLKQQYVTVNDTTWRLYNQRYRLKGNILGINIKARALSQFTQYKLNPNWKDNPFKGPVVKVPADTQKQDSAYWEKIRPFELTPAEAKDYSLKDSLQEVRSKPSYIDSVDSVRNQPELVDFLIGGYDYRKRTKNLRFETPSLIGALFHFNTVEGFAPQLDLSFTKTVDNASDWEFEPFFRYGMANENFNGGIRVTKSPFYAGFGREVQQFQTPPPISSQLNASYSLFDGRNFARLYQQAFVEMGYQGDEWGNGWFPSLSVSFQERQPLTNNTSYTLAKSENYQSNIPDHPNFDANNSANSQNFPKHRALVIKAGMRYKPGLDYMKIKGEKVNLGTDWPTLKVNYRGAIAGVAGSDAKYHFIESGLEGNADLKLFGNLSYEASAGRFLSQNRVPFMDYRHFQGQEIIFQEKGMRDFQLADYYQFSTTEPFTEGHLQHNFSGFIWNKLPLARKLNWQVSATGNLLYQEAVTSWEWGVGLTDLIGLAGSRFFSVHFFQSYQSEAFQDRGFRIGFSSPLGL
jgi:hypothetical protein